MQRRNLIRRGGTADPENVRRRAGLLPRCPLDGAHDVPGSAVAAVENRRRRARRYDCSRAVAGCRLVAAVVAVVLGVVVDLGGAPDTAGAVSVVADTFNRADSSSSLGTSSGGQVWSPRVGTWGISSNMGYVATPTSGFNFATIEQGGETYDLQASVTLSGTSNRATVGLVVRYSDTSNYDLVRLDARASVNGVRLFKVNAGVGTQVGAMAGTLVNGETYVVRVEVRPTATTVFLDGVAIVTTASATGNTGTDAGLTLLYGASDNDDGGSRFDGFDVDDTATTTTTASTTTTTVAPTTTTTVPPEGDVVVLSDGQWSQFQTFAAVSLFLGAAMFVASWRR